MRRSSSAAEPFDRFFRRHWASVYRFCADREADEMTRRALARSIVRELYGLVAEARTVH